MALSEDLRDSEQDGVKGRTVAKVMTVVVVAIIIIAVLSFVTYRYVYSDYYEGEIIYHDRKYQYSISVVNVTGSYEVIVPLVVMRSGNVLDLIDFGEVAPGRCEVVDTDHGWGLRVWGSEPVEKKLEGKVTHKLESELGEYGYPFLSMTEENITDFLPWEEDDMHLWMYSTCSTLQVYSMVRTDSHREWVNWRGEVTWASGTGSMLELFNTTAVGWNLYWFHYEMLYIAN